MKIPQNTPSENSAFRKLHHNEKVTGTFVFRSLVLSFPGTLVPRNSRSQELSFPGTFAPLSKNEV